MQQYDGIINSWKKDKGFGFIRPSNGGKDVFIHLRDLKHSDYQPKLGDIVYFKVIADKDGKVRAYDAFIQGQAISNKHRQKTFRKNNPISKKSSPNYLVTPFILLVAACPFVFSAALIIDNYNFIPLFAYLLLSLITFIVYAYDKTKAHHNAWRVSEQTLHLLAFFGGWPGALITQRLIRHKNKKTSFQTTTWLIIFFHMAIWAGITLPNSAVISSFSCRLHLTC